MRDESELDKAICRYLGYGETMHPVSGMERLTPEAAEKWGAAIETILSGLSQWKPEWTDVRTGLREIEKEVRETHPELGPRAVQAIVWAYSYWWK